MFSEGIVSDLRDHRAAAAQSADCGHNICRRSAGHARKALNLAQSTAPLMRNKINQQLTDRQNPFHLPSSLMIWMDCIR